MSLSFTAAMKDTFKSRSREKLTPIANPAVFLIISSPPHPCPWYILDDRAMNAGNASSRIAVLRWMASASGTSRSEVNQYIQCTIPCQFDGKAGRFSIVIAAGGFDLRDEAEEGGGYWG